MYTCIFRGTGKCTLHEACMYMYVYMCIGHTIVISSIRLIIILLSKYLS